MTQDPSRYAVYYSLHLYLLRPEFFLNIAVAIKLMGHVEKLRKNMVQMSIFNNLLISILEN
jgi:hypothetical protein